MRYCFQCGARVPLLDGCFNLCCPPVAPTADPLCVTYEGVTVRAVALEEEGADAQKAIRILASMGGRCAVDDLLEALGWEPLRFYRVSANRTSPRAATLYPILTGVDKGQTWAWLTDRTWDGLPERLWEKAP